MPSLVRKQSYGSVTVFWLDREAAVLAVKERSKKILQERCDVKKIYLFGSLVTGKAVPGSDADVLIVLTRSDKRFIDRPLEFYKYFENIGIPVDLFCYTEDEINRTTLAQSAVTTGTAICSSNDQ